MSDMKRRPVKYPVLPDTFVIEWCVEHQSGFIPQHEGHVKCDAFDAKHAYGYDREPCRIEKRFLVAALRTTTEEP